MRLLRTALRAARFLTQWFKSVGLLFCLPFLRRPSNKGAKRPKVAAVVLSYKRVMNIPWVVMGLRRQSYIDDIIIFQNAPSRLRIPGCINIFSDLNLKCIVRHQIAALLDDYDYIVFCDDDAYLSQDLTEDVLPAIERYGEQSVLGFFGHNLNWNQPEKAYSTGKLWMTQDAPAPTDLVKGVFHIVRRADLAKISGELSHLKLEDDIRINVLIQKLHQQPSYVIRLRFPLVPLRENDAVWKRDGHFAARDKAIQDAIAIGWRPISRAPLTKATG